MKIGFFTDAFRPIISGVTVSIDILTEELRKKGHEVYIFTNSHDDAKQEKNVVRLSGMKLPMKGLEAFRISKVTRKRIKMIGEIGLDIIHCHSEFTMGRLGRKVAKKYNIPLVHTYHTMLEEYVHYITKFFEKPLRYVSRKYSKSFAESVDKVIFPSKKVQDTFAKYGYKDDFEIIPTGIDINRYHPENINENDLKNLKKDLNITPNDFVLEFLGRVSKEKSLDQMAKEVVTVLERYKNTKFLVVGDGPDLDTLLKTFKDNNLSDRVISTGMVPNNQTQLYYNIGDLFINFSLSETQGLTYIEALASGLPILVKYDDNLENLINEGLNGYSFKNDDEFITLFDTLYNSDVLKERYCDNCIKSVQDYSKEMYAQNILNVYKQLID